MTPTGVEPGVTLNLTRTLLTLPRPTLTPTWLILAVAAFLVGVDNFSFWRALVGAHGVLAEPGPGFLLAIAGLLMGAFTFLLSLVGWPYLLKPALMLVLIAAAAAAYFMDSYGIVIDDGMLRNVLETDYRETAGLWNVRLVLRVGLTGVLPALAVAWTRVHFLGPLREAFTRLALGMVALALALGAVASQYKDFALIARNHRELRYLINPTYPLYAVVDFTLGEVQAVEMPLQPLGRDAGQRGHGERKAVLVLVVGETARAANFGINGYDRPTTPRLAAADVVNFDNFRSCGTSTATSLPCMFSSQQRAEFDNNLAEHTENLLDVLDHAGLEVFWRDNNSGCKGVCARVASTDMTDAGVHEYCSTGECFDEVLLHGLGKHIDAADGDTVVVLHQHGSHGPDYYRRHPARFTRFTPECASNAPHDCSRAEIVNAYDNTILYTDHVLGEVIDFLRARSDDYDTAMIYVSDHGESLGEDGIYLHGFPYAIAPEQQTHVPFVVWLSDGFRQNFGIDTGCLRRHADQRYSHDNLFSSVLGLMRVETEAYRSDNDLFRPCRRS